MLRVLFVALALLAPAAPAFALTRDDVSGAWISQWANATGEDTSGGGPMQISVDSNPDSLDGLTPSPGFDGVMNGEVSDGPDGALIWEGRRASIWPEGATTGTFRIVFSNADNFTGTWSTDDGEVQDAAWNGQRGD